MFKFTATLFCENQEIDSQSGNDLDALYIWMLTQAQGKFGDFNGTIIENKTSKIIRTFRSSAGE